LDQAGIASHRLRTSDMWYQRPAGYYGIATEETNTLKYTTVQLNASVLIYVVSISNWDESQRL